jgi:hypothetical protein
MPLVIGKPVIIDHRCPHPLTACLGEPALG